MLEDQFKVTQLKATLRQLGLPQTGDKSSLLKRLHASDPSGAWKDIAKKIILEESEQQTGEEDSQDNTRMEQGDRAENSNLQREMDRMRCENECMRRQLEELRFERRRVAECVPEVSFRNVDAIAVSRPTITALGELLGEFTGAGDTFCVWQKQLELVRTTYQLEDSHTRILIGMKLKQKALNWFHANSEHLEIPVAELIERMKRMFDHRPAKFELRRKFEKRSWRNDESFGDYYFEKVIMASKLSVDEDELIDCIIDGIPEVPLRNQARMQRFDTKEDLLRAFEQIKLQPENKKRLGYYGEKMEQQSRFEDAEHRQESKCYNCNKEGHIAKNCDKPKRDRGSCFECGLMDHQFRDCKKRKQATTTAVSNSKKPEGQISSVAVTRECENEYRHQAEVQIRTDIIDCKFFVDSQLDSGCPISLIKERLIPLNLIKQYENECYEGINGSVLEIKGIIEAKIFVMDATSENVVLRVVPEYTMKCDALLGRDALKKLGLTIVKQLKKHEVENITPDILNIEVNVVVNEKVVELNVNQNLPIAIKNQVIDHFQSNYLLPERPAQPKIKAELKLNVENKQPFHYAPSRLTIDEKKKVQIILDDLLERGIIRPSVSEYASRTVLVRKKDGGIRLCIDFRTLNKITARENYPIPLIEEQVEALEGKRYFTSLDLKEGFHHVYIHKDSVKYTAFITPFGQFEYVKMPFGLKNASARFQRYINEIFEPMIRSGMILVYIDDFLIATKTVEEHLEVLDRVFKLMVENKLELRLEKCRFLYEEIEYLGYKISDEGLQPNDAGIKAVKEFPTPKNVRDVQSFLGLSSYFRKFVKDFSLIAAPLCELIKKNATFVFGVKQREAFELLKEKLTSKPILSIYNPRDETELHCDASSRGYGAVLLQRKSDQKFHPIFYFSKRTTEVESRYHSYELETLAIIHALRRFRVYLLGITFKIITDCNALVMTLNKKEINPRIARWALELQNYDFKTVHRPGKRMQHVDALSRSFNILVIEPNTFEFELAVCQKQDPIIKKLRECLELKQEKMYEMRNGIVYRKKNKQVLFYVPSAMERDLLHKYHNEFGHFGVDKTLALLQEAYWFPNMKAKIREHIDNCTKCIAFSKTSGKDEGFLHNIPKENVPFNMLHVDHFGPVDRANASKKYVFLIVDAFTKFVKLYAVKTTTSRDTIRCLKEYFNAYSKPKILISDRGTGFTSKEFENFLNKNNVKHIKIATASPQANGQVERYNRILTPMLGKLFNGKEWHKSLGEIEFAINNTVNRATGETPSKLLFGVSQRGYVQDALKEYIIEQKEHEKRDLEQLRANAAEKIEKASEYNERYVNKKRKKAREFFEGDLVVVKNFDSTGGKLNPAYRGPYRVICKLKNDRYIVADIEGCQVSQRPYQGTWGVDNMKPWRKVVGKNNVKNNLDLESENEESDIHTEGEENARITVNI